MTLVKTFFTEFSLLKRIMWAMGAAAVMAVVLQVTSGTVFYENTVHVFDTIGKVFINCLKMLVVPIVFVSMACGITSMKDASKIGKFAGGTIAFYVLTTFIAVSISLSAAVLLGIGSGSEIDTAAAIAPAVSQNQTVADMIINIFPSNPVQAMAEGNMLAIIFMSMMFGLSISVLGSKVKGLNDGLNQLNEVFLKWIEIVMLYFAPIGVFALLSKALGTQGLDTFIQLVGFFIFTALALVFHGVVTLGLLFKVKTGLSLKTFFSKAKTVMLTAFSTSSSSATLPFTMRTLEERMGINNSVASFTAPMGATINMDGTAIMQGAATVFIANLYGIDLSMGDYLTVIGISVIASIGTAGVPGVGLVMLAMVFQKVGIPVEGIALLAGIDRLLDMIRTTVNVTGDMVVSTIIAKNNGMMDIDEFNNPDAGAVEMEIELHPEQLVKA